MAKKKKNPHALPFKLSGAVTPGCKYAVVSWKVGRFGSRKLVSCHRSRSKANTAAKKFAKDEGYMQMISETLRGFGIGKRRRVAVFNLTTGKKVK